MENKNAKALKSGFWYVFANFLVRGISIITTPIFSRLLTHDEVGSYSNFHSWVTIAVIVVTMRMESSMISAKFDYKDRLGQYNRSMITLTGVITGIWALVVNAFPSFFTDRFGFSQFYINLMLIYCFFHAIINIFQINERYAFRYKRSVFIAILTAVSTAVFSVLLVLVMKDRLTGRVIGGIFPVAVIGLVLFCIFFKRDRSVDPSSWAYTLKISLPYIPHLLSLQVLNSVDRIMITRICGAADNALYTIAYSCGHIVTLLMTAMNRAYSPWLGDKLNEGAKGEIRKVTNYYISLFCVLAVGMMLLAPELLLVMGGRSYLEARYVMPPVAMGCVCQFIYTLYVNVEQFKKKTIGMAIASVSAALLNYGLNAYFIPIYGYNAAAYTTLAGYLFLLTFHMLLVRRMKLGDVFDNRYVLLIVGGMMLLTLGINLIYGHTIMRYLLILVYIAAIALIAIKKKELIMNIAKKIIK